MAHDADETTAPGRRLLGRALLAAGLLIGGLSGLCTGGAFLLFLLVAVSYPPQSLGALYEPLATPFMYGGFYLGLGGAALVLAGPAGGKAPRRALAWTAFTLALLVLTSSGPAAWYVLTRGPVKPPPHTFNLDPRSDRFMTPMAALGGLLLMASAVYELRRRPAGRFRSPRPGNDELNRG